MTISKKLVGVARGIYKASITLAFKLNNRRDRIALKRYQAEIEVIDRLQARAERILASVQDREDEANRRIGDLQAEIIADRNEYQNLLEDLG